MKFAIRDHRGQSAPFLNALLAAGHEPSSDPDVVLIDYDLPHPAYQPWVEAAKTLIVYPHGASFVMGHDLAGEPIRTDATFVLGPGQQHLLEAYDYPNPVHVCGWPWGERVEPTPRPLNRILFCPLHPLGSGYLREDLKELNREAFDILLNEHADLRVRHIGPLELSGLSYEPGVEYLQGQPGSMAGIKDADVVVASQTFAAHAMTKGWPVVTFAFEREWRLESEHDLSCTWAPDWEQFSDYAAYPYQLAPGVCQEAAENPNPLTVEIWKKRFLGPEFEPERFAAIVERSVNAKARHAEPEHATR